jgi:hypothetical protein
MMSDPVVMSKVEHFAYHTYEADTGGADAVIRSSAYPDRNFWISEVTNPPEIMDIIGENLSAVMVWDGYDSVYNHAILAGRGSDPPNDQANGSAPLSYSTSTGLYTPRKKFYETAQIFKWVPGGSMRIGAVESISNLTIYAFYHAASGRLTIVGRNAGSSSLSFTGSLRNLPLVSVFEHYFTDATRNVFRSGDVVVSGSATFSVTVPGGSYFTLTGLVTP